MDYRKRLKKLRRSCNLSQVKVGKAIFISRQGYSHIENGRAELKVDDLITLCDFYGVSSDYLIGLKDNSEEPSSPSRFEVKT